MVDFHTEEGPRRRDIKRGWGLGLVGRTPAAYCAALAADPALFVRERRMRKRNSICVDALAKGLLGLGRVDISEAEFEARVDGLLATIAAPDSPAFLVVNERYDESLVAFARECQGRAGVHRELRRAPGEASRETTFSARAKVRPRPRGRAVREAAGLGEPRPGDGVR